MRNGKPYVVLAALAVIVVGVSASHFFAPQIAKMQRANLSTTTAQTSTKTAAVVVRETLPNGLRVVIVQHRWLQPSSITWSAQTRPLPVFRGPRTRRST
jgi:hypothetical protein